MLIKYFSITALSLLLIMAQVSIGVGSLILELSWQDQSDDVQSSSGLSGSYIDIRSFDLILLQDSNTLELIIGFYTLEFFKDFAFSIFIQSQELIDSGSDWQDMRVSQLMVEGNHSLTPSTQTPEWKLGTQRNNITGEYPDLSSEIVFLSSIHSGQGVYNMTLILRPVFSYSHFEYDESITYSLDLRVSQTINNIIYSDTLIDDIKMSTNQYSIFLPVGLAAGLILMTIISIIRKKR